MQLCCNDYTRSEEERKEATSNHYIEGFKPRLWAPIYDPNVTYIVFESSNQTCSAKFPHKEEEFQSYCDYFKKRRGYIVSPSCKLFFVHRLWHLPQSAISEKVKLSNPKQDFDGLQGLTSALLPQDACFETPFSDAGLFLHSVLLPQTLYCLNQNFTAHAFLNHCEQNFPCLFSYLSRVSIEDVVTCLTAKSTALLQTYDRLEYLGDAVLKLVHTDDLLNLSDTNIIQWINCLHEGDLSALRSFLGCNIRLHDVAKRMCLDQFILVTCLGRGTWVPIGFHFFDEEKSVDSSSPSVKVCADVVEAFLGLVYITFGYQAAKDVTQELGISPKVPPKKC